MNYKDLTKYKKMRFDSNAYCKICKKPISKSASFEMIAVKNGKCMCYNFFHSDCVFEEVDKTAQKYMLGYS